MKSYMGSAVLGVFLSLPTQEKGNKSAYPFLKNGGGGGRKGFRKKQRKNRTGLRGDVCSHRQSASLCSHT